MFINYKKNMRHCLELQVVDKDALEAKRRHEYRVIKANAQLINNGIQSFQSIEEVRRLLSWKLIDRTACEDREWEIKMEERNAAFSNRRQSHALPASSGCTQQEEAMTIDEADYLPDKPLTS